MGNSNKCIKIEIILISFNNSIICKLWIVYLYQILKHMQY